MRTRWSRRDMYLFTLTDHYDLSNGVSDRAFVRSTLHVLLHAVNFLFLSTRAIVSRSRQSEIPCEITFFI